MTNPYVSLDTLKSSGVFNVTGTGDDTRMRLLTEAVSRACDDFMNRRMYSRIETIYFSGNGKKAMLLPDDLISVTTLKEDEDLDGATYETTWKTTDYVLAPYDADPTLADPDRALPYWVIEVDRRTQGSQSAFGKGQRRFELAGKWGWSESTKDSGATVNDNPLAAGATTINVGAGEGSKVEIGQTIVIESEQFYITNIVTDALTVDPGVNGTTQASHAQSTAINIVQYPSPIREAVIIETARLWTMKSSGFASSVGNQDTGVVQVFGGELHPRARALLNPFRRIGV